MREQTKAVHGPHRHGDPHTRALSVPIYQSAVFGFESTDQGAAVFAGERADYFYTRMGNPTIRALEEKLAFLEGGSAAIAYASGMAAISATILACCRQGDAIIAVRPIYGCTYSLLTDLLPRWGITVRWAAAADFTREAARLVDARTRLVLVETPVNPTLEVIDLAGAARVAHGAGARLAVDNTFATFCCQKPLAHGADVVVYSATKFISGHGDTVGGAVISTDEFIKEMREYVLRDLGGIISPFNAWLLLRGLKSIALRMERHSANALRVAQFLAGRPKVAFVRYPGLPAHPQHEIARRQMAPFSGMVAFEMRGGRPAGKRLLDGVRLCLLAVSLGDTSTLIEHPASMTHAGYGPEALAAAGITEGLVRLSVGIEDADDLIEDLDQALARV